MIFDNFSLIIIISILIIFFYYDKKINTYLDKFTLIFIIIIFILTICNYYPIERMQNLTYFDNNANYEYVTDLDKNDKSTINNILLIGKDISDNNIFKHENNFYISSDDTLVLYNDENKNIKYFEYPTNVPIDFSKMKLKIKIHYNGYNYIGVLTNFYYKQEYLLYEKYEVDELDISIDKLY